jgi:hypothetical protein
MQLDILPGSRALQLDIRLTGCAETLFRKRLAASRSRRHHD